MVMETLQIRLNPGILKRLDEMINDGMYSSRSDVVRDAVRRFIDDKNQFRKYAGIMHYKGEGVELVREARKKLSKEPFDIDEINSR